MKEPRRWSDRRSRSAPRALFDPERIASLRQHQPRPPEQRAAELQELLTRVRGQRPVAFGPLSGVARVGLAAALMALLFSGASRLATSGGSPASSTPAAARAGAVPEPDEATAAAAGSSPAAWQPATLGALGELQVAAGSVYALEGDFADPLAPHALRLERGSVCAGVSHRPRGASLAYFQVHARPLMVKVVGTRFCVERTEGPEAAAVSAVRVDEGAVEVSSSEGGSLRLAAGQAVRSDDRRFGASGGSPSPLPAPAAERAAPSAPAQSSGRPAVASSPAAPAAARNRLARASPSEPRLGEPALGSGPVPAAGGDLVAQNALFSAALQARDVQREPATALGIFRAYEARFPGGLYAFESGTGALQLLEQLGRSREALEEADTLLARFGQRPQADDLRLSRARLLCGPLARASEGELAYRSLLRVSGDQSVDQSVRETAWFELARCQAAAGEPGAAAQTAAQYLKAFPAGRFAAEAGRLGAGAE